MLEEAILSPVRTLLRKTKLARKDAVLLAAVSGGSDSVALLHALNALKAEFGFSLRAVYIQHGLRGDSTLEDERFVRQLCEQLSVPLQTLNAGLAGDMNTPGVETRARLRRRELFAEAMKTVGADALLLGHHQGDQAETVLMHLLRGAGAKGLSGMSKCVPFENGVALRPFLSLPKQALLDALSREGLKHREDESNRIPCTPRNALRLQVFPLLNQLFPAAEAHIAWTADALGADESYLQKLGDELYYAVRIVYATVFAARTEQLRRAPEALSRRALRSWVREGLALAELYPDERAPSRVETLALLELLRAERGASVNLSNGLQAVAGSHCLHLQRQNGEPLMRAEPMKRAEVQALNKPYTREELRKRVEAFAQGEAPKPAEGLRTAEACQTIPIDPSWMNYTLAGLSFELTPAGRVMPPCDAWSVLLTPQMLRKHPVLRLARQSDSIMPFGAGGSKPLRRYLTDRKLDRPFRRALPVLAIDDAVLWLPALCASEEMRLSGETEGCYRLRLISDPPYLP